MPRRTQLKYRVDGNHEIGTPHRQLVLPDQFKHFERPTEINMSKGEKRSNRETKKPKKEKIKVIAAAPSQKTASWQPSFGSGKKK
jgi:hypothetical protein